MWRDLYISYSIKVSFEKAPRIESLLVVVMDLGEEQKTDCSDRLVGCVVNPMLFV